MQLPLALLAEPQPFDPGRYMALVGALIVALLAIGLGFRRLVGGALKQRAAQRSLRVVDVLPLGGKRQLAVAGAAVPAAAASFFFFFLFFLFRFSCGWWQNSHS